MTDADDKDHTVEVGTWWWARLESGASPEAVRIARHGVEVVGSELGCAYRWAALLEPVVPYVPAGVAPRSPRYDPRPGDTYRTDYDYAGGVVYTVEARRGDLLVLRTPSGDRTERSVSWWSTGVHTASWSAGGTSGQGGGALA